MKIRFVGLLAIVGLIVFSGSFLATKAFRSRQAMSRGAHGSESGTPGDASRREARLRPPNADTPEDSDGNLCEDGDSGTPDSIPDHSDTAVETDSQRSNDRTVPSAEEISALEGLLEFERMKLKDVVDQYLEEKQAIGDFEELDPAVDDWKSEEDDVVVKVHREKDRKLLLRIKQGDYPDVDEQMETIRTIKDRLANLKGIQ